MPLDEAAALSSGTGGPATALAWHDDYPMAETLDALAMVAAAHRAAGWAGDAAPRWWIHQIVLEDRPGRATVVGDIGFHGPPSVEGCVEVEIGYDVVFAVRGRGVATQACRLLLQQAWRDGAELVRAETEPDNPASQQVLWRSGFTHLGSFQFAIRRPEREETGA